MHGLSFTGSNEVGSQLYATGALQLKKCQCEMGGKNPSRGPFGCGLALRDGIDAFGAFASTGQRCTATSRVVIEEKVADQFVTMLVERAKKFSVGDGLDAGVEMGPSVDESQMNTVLRYIEIGKHEGNLLLGGQRL